MKLRIARKIYHGQRGRYNPDQLRRAFFRYCKTQEYWMELIVIAREIVKRREEENKW